MLDKNGNNVEMQTPPDVQAMMLDDHQCALAVIGNQYRKHHWMSEGAESFLSIHELLNEHIEMSTSTASASASRVLAECRPPTPSRSMNCPTSSTRWKAATRCVTTCATILSTS